MGELEFRSKKRTRNTKIVRAILTVLAVGVAGTLNPQGLVRGVLKELKSGKTRNRSAETTISSARRRLIKRGLIEWQDGKLRLTGDGEKKFRMFDSANLRGEKSKRWDKKWRILIFDIREERKSLREKVRRTLISIGFKRLQDSVWVFPHDCEDLVVLLKADFHIGKDLLYIIADEIENDGWLRKEFGL